MADNSTPVAGLQPHSDATIPRIRLAEAGFTGLRVNNKTILEETNRVFRHPDILKTVSEMRLNPTVAAALSVYKMLIGKVKWTVEPPLDATDEQKTRAKFVEQCVADMEGSWGSFISETLTYLEYGFSVQEKVFRRRLTKNGSRYNDGLVGIRKIAPRGQDTIRKWYFSEDGRYLEAIGQSLINLENGYRYQDLIIPNGDGVIQIPREKFLLFTADSTKNNPQGNSLLKYVYLAYKRLELLQDQECLGISKDLSGIPLIQLPPKYMAPDANADDAAVFAMCKTIVDNISRGTQQGIVFPIMYDLDSKLPLFDIKLLEHKGNPAFDLDAIIKRYQNDILTALCANVISSETFSLDGTDNNLLTLALGHRLGEIAEVLNGDLIPQLFALNGWTDTELPKFTPGNIEQTSMEEFSKYIQRVASVGLLEIDRPMLNRIREVGAIPLKHDDEPVDEENLTMSPSRSGDGMAVGKGGNGTADAGKGNPRDNSAANKENKG